MQHSSRPVVRRIASLAGAAALAVSLVACTGEPEPTPTPTPDANAPVFESDEEAFAAVEEALNNVYDVLGSQGELGEVDAEAIEAVMIDPAAAEHIEDMTQFAASGDRIDGRTSYDSLKIADRWTSKGSATVVVYYCIDNSTTRIFDANGSDVTPPDRKLRAPRSSVLVSDAPGSQQLVLKEVNLWDGEDFC